MKDHSSEIIHTDITVRGRVQGVGFRYSAESQARKLGLRGFVKNEPNGDVYIEIEGNQMLTDMMLDWCRRGPGISRVDHVFTSGGPLKNFRSFRIAY
jgi:acylphosphatase